MPWNRLSSHPATCRIVLLTLPPACSLVRPLSCTTAACSLASAAAAPATWPPSLPALHCTALQARCLPSLPHSCVPPPPPPVLRRRTACPITPACVRRRRWCTPSSAQAACSTRRCPRRSLRWAWIKCLRWARRARQARQRCSAVAGTRAAARAAACAHVLQRTSARRRAALPVPSAVCHICRCLCRRLRRSAHQALTGVCLRHGRTTSSRALRAQRARQPCGVSMPAPPSLLRVCCCCSGTRSRVLSSCPSSLPSVQAPYEPNARGARPPSQPKPNAAASVAV